MGADLVARYRLERGGDARDALQKHAVGAAEYGILLVQRRGDAAQRGRHQRREGRITAEAHHGRAGVESSTAGSHFHLTLPR